MLSEFTFLLVFTIVGWSKVIHHRKYDKINFNVDLSNEMETRKYKEKYGDYGEVDLKTLKYFLSWFVNDMSGQGIKLNILSGLYMAGYAFIVFVAEFSFF